MSRFLPVMLFDSRPSPIKNQRPQKEYEPPMTFVIGGFKNLDAEPRPLVPLHLECLTICRFSQCLSFKFRVACSPLETLL